MNSIHKPIFIVGVPRSGTSLVHGIMAQHPDSAYLTKTTKKFPRSVWLTRLVQLVHRDQRPTEAGRLWARFGHEGDDTLGREDVTPEARAYFRRVVAAQLALGGGTRFLSKHTRNALRMPYFETIFPDAVFVHVIRDGRAVTNSILRCRQRHGDEHAYWGIRPPGWRDLQGLDPVAACARQWALTVDYTRASANDLAQSKYVELRYEDLSHDPEGALRRVAETCELEWKADQLAEVAGRVRSMNHKWREELSPDQVAAVNSLLASKLQELGYEV